MDLEQVRKELERNQAILLDVREQNEWNQDHLPQSQLIPLSDLEEGLIPDLPKDKIIYTHCRKGGRAQIAATILKETYTDVVPLKCTFEELKKMKFPLGTV